MILCPLNCAFILSCACVGRADEAAAHYQALMNRVAPAIVTVKVVMKTDFGGQGRETEARVNLQGAVVDKEGLVMITNAAFSTGRLMALMGQGDGSSQNIKSTPVDFKVVFDREEREYSAFLAATDTKLDIAFIKIEDLGDRKPDIVDFSNAAPLEIGQEVITVSRLEKGFDYAPFFATARVGGMIERPRKAYLLAGSGNFGLPLFALNGQVLGVVTTVESGVKSEGIGQDVGTMLRFASGGGGLLRAFIVPSSVIYGVIGQARVRAVTLAQERAKRHAAGADESKKPAVGKAATDKSKPATGKG
jgi:S1-C subfamily serine protease